jgi:polyisoprenyl-phosphate glycosyltransferase
MISVISPIFNEEDSLRNLCERIGKTLVAIGEEDYEILLVDNGSHDGSLETIKLLREQDKRIKYISLSRNFGHQGGILAGLEHATGDAVISIDGDLQQPPELIAEMVKLWQSGFQVVYTIKTSRSYNFSFRQLFTFLFYKLLSRISDLKLSHGQSDFRLLDRKIVNILNNMPERNKFLRGMVEWVGFKQTFLEYNPSDRLHGESKFSIKQYINFAVDGIVSFSILPLRLVLLFGIGIACLCFVYVVILFITWALSLTNLNVMLPPGWATIAVSISFLGGVQLISIGLVGEYISRIFSQTKNRPEYIIREINITNSSD